MNSNLPKYCFLTFDVEEWFQVENLRQHISRRDWDTKPSSISKNTQRILRLLAEHNIKATFFVLAWIAEKYPSLVKEISAAGHEIASHGYGHELTYKLNDQSIRIDVKKSKQLLEDVTGHTIYGYRAPNFSIDDRLMDLLKTQGFEYDSSYLPFKLNRRYGCIERIKKVDHGIIWHENGLAEIPLSMGGLGSLKIPASGGAYFRLIPFNIFRFFVSQILEIQPFYNFYLHPWEFEPEQPRISNLKLNYKIRHYTGLARTAVKAEKLISFLKNYGCHFSTIGDYLKYISKM
jgi:polysaccharide deacetylase family protein (PEP-CTERM system associated)